MRCVDISERLCTVLLYPHTLYAKKCITNLRSFFSSSTESWKSVAQSGEMESLLSKVNYTIFKVFRIKMAVVLRSTLRSALALLACGWHSLVKMLRGSVKFNTSSLFDWHIFSFSANVRDHCPLRVTSKVFIQPSLLLGSILLTQKSETLRHFGH